jgi:hypothetical protein
MNCKLMGIGVAICLASCATPAAKLGPLPYDFTVVQVEDARPDDDTKLMNAEGFGAEKLIAAWQRVVQRNVWGSTPAELAIRVTQYEATHSGQSYALSLSADLAASQPGIGASYAASGRRVVAQQSAQCVAIGRSTGGAGGARVAEAVFGTAAPQGNREGAPRGMAALTVAGRDATLWQELWTQCAHQLATQFTQALLAAPPAPLADTRGR